MTNANDGLNKKTVLLIEDEQTTVDVLKPLLIKNGYTVIAMNKGEEGLHALYNEHVDIILLGLLDKSADGFDLLKQLRMSKEIGYVPVIMVSARNDEIDKVLCLEIGADDYVTKPFAYRELLARIKAVIRRSELTTPQLNEMITLGALQLVESKRIFTKNGDVIGMTLKEYELLRLLIKNPGVVYSREELLGTIWGYDSVGGTRTVDVHIRQLRKKIESDDSHPEYIMTVRGTGYKMREL